MRTLLILAAGFAGTCSGQLPEGWITSGSHPRDYEMSLDKAAAHTGKGSGHMKAKPGAQGFATLMQNAKVDAFRGKRVRMTVYVKTVDAGQAAPWMRVDGREGILTFDNMIDRPQKSPITGTTPWRKYELVLDVPETSIRLAYGLMLSGQGEAWLDDLQFEVVPETVPSTDIQAARRPRGLPTAGPVNLDFEK